MSSASNVTQVVAGESLPSPSSESSVPAAPAPASDAPTDSNAVVSDLSAESSPPAVAAEAGESADWNGGAQAPTPAPLPVLDVRRKQVKTVVKEVTKKRKWKDGFKTVTFWEVRVGSAISKVYVTPSGDRELFTLAYWVDGQRRRQVFPTKSAAVEAAKKPGGDIGSGKATAAEFSPQQLLACARACDLVAPFNVPIDVVASVYALLRQRLGDFQPMQVIECCEKAKLKDVVPKMVKDVVSDMLKVKRSDRLSERYLKQLEYDLERFSRRFRGRLNDVNGRDVDAWLRDLGVGPRTRNNLRNSVNALFKFGIAQKYLPKDHDEIEAVAVAKDTDGEIEIYTPEKMKELLEVASAEHVPFLAISAFAGVRHAELQRLDWAHVKRDGMIIEIKAGTAKTASRRVIPIRPNLAKWLKPHWKEAGKICSYANMVLQFVELTRRVNEKRRAAWAKVNEVSKERLDAADAAAAERVAKLDRNERRSRGTVMPGAETAEEESWKPFLWKHNALRHSFISYRVAQTQNVAQVALEAGNSPQMIFQHYRELVRKAEGEKWFEIAPTA